MKKDKSILPSDVATFNSSARDVSSATIWLHYSYMVHFKHCKLRTVLAKKPTITIVKVLSPKEWTNNFCYSILLKWQLSGHSCRRKQCSYKHAFAHFYKEAPQSPSCLFSRDKLECVKVSLKILAWNARWKHWIWSPGISRSHSKIKVSSCPTPSKRILLYYSLNLKHSIWGNILEEWCFCFSAEWDGK